MGGLTFNEGVGHDQKAHGSNPERVAAVWTNTSEWCQTGIIKSLVVCDTVYGCANKEYKIVERLRVSVCRRYVTKETLNFIKPINEIKNKSNEIKT